METSAEGEIVIAFPKWIEAAFRLGLPSMLVIFFVFWTTQKVDLVQAKQTEQHNVMSQQLSDVLRESTRANDTNRAMLNVMQAACVNQAKDREERQRCMGLTP